MKAITANAFVVFAGCNVYDAIRAVEFQRTLSNLDSGDRTQLMRAYLATRHLPGDASLERAAIVAVIERTRDLLIQQGR